VGARPEVFYAMKPLVPRWLQLVLRRRRLLALFDRHVATWPVWDEAAAAPAGWPGWPDGKRFALVLTHDVEHARGVKHCDHVAELERDRGMRSAFAFVPERYETPPALRERLREQGFEIMVHGLKHDGKLFRDRATFERRARAIRAIMEEWGTRGFAAPAAHHHFEWLSELDLDYDISSYHFDPFEPQPCGLGRIFPFWVGDPDGSGRGFVELPYTLPQDFTLYVLLRERSSAMWRMTLDWIARRGGMALVKTHPDYMAFGPADRGSERYPAQRYAELLDHVRRSYGDSAWVALPSEVAAYWRSLGSLAGGAITSQPTFCPLCRASHARGWMRDYAPGPDVAAAPATAPGVRASAPADRGRDQPPLMRRMPIETG
jgi:hypothetical protein